MRRFMIRLSAALLTLTIGASAAATWRTLTFPSPPAVTVRYKEPAPDLFVVDEVLTFTPTFRACKPGWAQGYEASDGEKLSEWSYPYGSPASAQSELRKTLKGALEIIERVPRLDEAGNRSERVVAVFPPDEYRDKKWVGILWTEGTSLRGIYAPNLRHAREFEKSESRW